MQSNDNIFEYARKLGSTHNTLVSKSKINNYQKDINEYIKYIEKVYDMLNIFNDLSIPINIPGQWLLDNMYIIQKEGISIKNDLNNVNYLELPRVDNILRIDLLAEELVNYSDGNLNMDNIRDFLYGYSKSKYIKLQELWIFPLMIKIELIKKIYLLSNKILNTHKQKYKVENIVERLVDLKTNKERKFNLKIKSDETSQINMPFIEYMAYKLKQLDKDGLEYIDIFDEEVLKLGTTVDEVVSRHHFDVVNRQISISNCILSLKNINNIDFSKEFENISEIDVILSKEKANIYSMMDYDTLNMYRKEICNISKKTGISQTYICNKIVELCNNNEGKKAHSGYYIRDKGIDELLSLLKYSKKKSIKDKNGSFGIYLGSIFSITTFVSIILGIIVSYNNNKLTSFISYTLSILLFLIPISQIVIYFIDKMLLKNIKPNILPSMDFEKDIPDKSKTFVIIPTILNSTKRVKELIESLEVYYLINKQNNIFFALLGDCSEINEKHIKLDDEIIDFGNKEIQKLNSKYKLDIPKFYFLYRDRIYNEKQEKYLGWERKRGLITQFNRFLIYGEKGDFNTNNINRYIIGDIKYVLTIDADTQVGINSISKLIGIISHPLNKAVLDENKKRVIEGYGILQPRISNSIECANKSIFSKIYAGYGGFDIYTNAVSDIYQDMWSEGIFTGKGIYDLKIFSDVLDKQIPENTVLSHDLLEGSFLRCGLVTNVEFVDNYPSRYNNYIVRQNRWLRGDIQIARWLKRDSSLSILSKWKILDNIRRGILDISLFVFVLLGLSILNIKWYLVFLFILLLYMFPSIIECIFSFKKIFSKTNKNYVRIIGDIEGNIYKSILEICFLPYKAINNIETFAKSIYRIKVSKKYLLEWLTAEEAEKTLGTGLKTYINDMYISLVSAGILISLTLINTTIKANMYFSVLLAFLWVLSPIIAWYISRDKKEEGTLNNEDRDFLTKISFDTWKYFDVYLNSENSYLIPDNYQENRKQKSVDRTSSTNIGLSFIAIMSAFDLKFINKEKAYSLIENILNTIDKLKKYRGNLYNWYNIKTLKPLNDNISSVDNGNYVAYLYVLKSFCLENFKDDYLIKRIDENINMLDFSLLYDNEKNLFSIEYNVRTNELSKSYYDLLASESRILSYVAIAKGDVPYKHWYSLSRSLVQRYGYKGLISWTGTSFEYFMPFELMKSYKYSLLDETYNFVIMNQVNYVSKKKIPWGISESAFNLFDMDYNYQYKAFGLPGLGLKRGLKDDLVISPYASILALPKYPKIVIENMKKLLEFECYGIYGYYDSIDFTKGRINSNKFVPVKTFMAHHQGLILMSISNTLNKNVFQNRFNKNPEIKSIDILLQEKVNNTNVLNKEKIIVYKEKAKSNSDDCYLYEKKISSDEKNIYGNVLSNNNYYVVCDNNNNGYSRYNNIYINRYRNDNNENGIGVYIKNKENDNIVDVMKQSNITYTSYNSIYEKRVNDLNIQLDINTLAEYSGEIRNLKLSNLGQKDMQFDIFFYMEPILSDINSDLSHRSYNNMFLEYMKDDNGLIIHRRKKHQDDLDIYLSSNIVCDTFDIGKIDFEIDKYKFIGRNKDILSSNAIKKDIPLNNSIMPTIEPIIAYKLSVIIPKETTINISYIQIITFDIKEANNVLKELSTFDKIKRNMNLCNNKSIVESKFYKYKPKEIEIYQNVITKIIYDNKYRVVYNCYEKMLQDNLWKYKISGDKPIIQIIINRKIEIIFLKQIIKMYKYIKSKLIDVDMVILVNSDEVYYLEIYDEIMQCINMEYINYEINNSIYIIKKNNMERNVIKLLDTICVLKLNGIDGILSNQFNKIVMNNISKTENNEYIQAKNEGEKIIYDKEKLLYNNDIGGFNNKNTNEYKIILENDYTTPTVWSNVLANKNFGTIVNENGGGYTWYNNSSQNKISKWKNDQVIDMPSEYIYIKEENNIYSITSSPYRIKDTNYIITHGLGFSKYETVYNDLYITQNVFVPLNDNVKVITIDIKNESDKIRKIELSYVFELLLGNEVSNKIYNVDINDNLVIVNEKYNINNSDKHMYISGFIHHVDNIVDNFEMRIKHWKEPYIYLGKTIEILQNEQKSITFLIGCEEEKDKINEVVCKYKLNAEKELNLVKEYWKDTCNIIKVKTPVESMNILLNGWLIYQTISSRLNARSGYYQSSGAFGFRDQLQDVLSIMMINPSIAKEQIIYHAKHQYIKGDVMHWWHDDTGAGLRSRYCDDMLWLVYVVLEYIKITGDEEILNEKASYVDSQILKEEEKHRYEIPSIVDNEETIYEHIIKSIDISIQYDNDNNLPNIGSGDWSDGLNNLFGQSVWLGFFLYDLLNNVLKYIKDAERKKTYESKINELEIGLRNSWDGKWYKRAFSKNNECIGSSQSDECKIDSIPQSWSVISNYKERDKNNIAMKSVDNILVDRDNKVIKLFWPPFNNTILDPGYIKSYIPGIRENGGQYTHAAIWNIVAQCILKNGNMAEEYFRMLNPIEHSRTNDACRKYKVEPYVISADIYLADGMIGRGGWTWYTGAASWMYKAGIEYILGFKKRGDLLILDPCINSSWKEFEIWYKYIDTNYHIKVNNKNSKQTGITNIWLDNGKLKENVIKLVNDNNNHEIEIEM